MSWKVKAAPRKDPLCVLWVSENRNALTEIADQYGVSCQFVGMVLHGLKRSRDGRVERALRERGAPLTAKV